MLGQQVAETVVAHCLAALIREHRVVARQMEWTPPELMLVARGIEWTLAGLRHHSAQVGSIRFPGKPEGPNED